MLLEDGARRPLAVLLMITNTASFSGKEMSGFIGGATRATFPVVVVVGSLGGSCKWCQVVLGGSVSLLRLKKTAVGHPCLSLDPFKDDFLLGPTAPWG